MNAITQNEPVSAQTLEHVLGTGDLSKLTSQQRVEYMARTCQSLGLNPLTRPFRFMNLSGQVTMYATRDCADQLRAIHKISLAIIDKHIDGELYVVTARAKTPNGREDEDVGAVSLGNTRGEFRANAILKAITKAKRRVTLSICGLGFLDETEVESLIATQGAQPFDAAEPLPEAAPTLPPPQEPKSNGRTVGGFLAALATDLAACETVEAVDAIAAREDVRKAGGFLKGQPFDEFNAMFRTAYDRIAIVAARAGGLDAENEM